jgi:hypothetical protein
MTGYEPAILAGSLANTAGMAQSQLIDDQEGGASSSRAVTARETLFRFWELQNRSVSPDYLRVLRE